MADLVNEALNLFPDSILFGSFLMGLVTVSAPHSVFFLSMILSLFVLYGLQTANRFIFGGSLAKEVCKPKLFKHTFEQLFISPSANSPSYAMFIVSFACSYLAGSLYNLKDELEVLDTSVMKQYYISITSLIVIAIIYLMYVLLYGCESMGSATSALLSGSITAMIIVNINVQLFGKNIVNFLGVPLLSNKTVDGKPIYICSK